MDIVKTLASEFQMTEQTAKNIVELIDEGNTIPFIARYRKELTDSCDDQVLREFDDRREYLVNLQKRKDEVTKSITDQGKWTDELAAALSDAKTLTEVEDIYRPYKQKKKTRASVAIAKGLQPLADLMLKQEVKEGNLFEIAAEFISEEKGVLTAEEALQGANDIVAEMVSDDANLRKILREQLFDLGLVSAKLLENEKSATYDMYKEYAEPIAKIPSHRILAINRGEKEECLKVTLEIDRDAALSKVTGMFLKGKSIWENYVNNACIDSYDRLISPSVEREVRNQLTDKANEQAIKMFEVNLKPLLMQPPLKGKTILAVDPAYRTGCKIAVIDANSNVLEVGVVYPTPPQSRLEEATAKLLQLIKKHNVDIISIGNGTASKEAEIFVANLIKECDRPVNYAVVNEAGASVYSASKLGAEEFPEYDVSLRSAVSIARRLQDPLAELIKIDVKSIGVGQYQHDMPQNRLSEVLNGVVENCVNSVGVDLNTASPSLLSFVAGLNSAVAKNVVEYRKKKVFQTRNELLKVAKLGPKAYEQCAGFLRIPHGCDVLDNTGVHPEAYDAVKKLLEHFKFTTEDVAKGSIKELPTLIQGAGEDKIAKLIGVGVPTLKDIVAELLKPGRDIRDSLPQPILRSDLLDIKDLRPGMELIGTVRNVIDFGVFVDIGVHQDGLVHISQIAEGYIKHPSEVLSVGEVVTVKVLDVDVQKKKISLTMRTDSAPQGKKANRPMEKPKQAVKEQDLDSLLKQLGSKYGRK